MDLMICKKFHSSYVSSSVNSNMSKALPYRMPDSMDSNPNVSKCKMCGTKFN